MKARILGCGASTGVPVITCNCEVCKSNNPKNKRLRSSLLIQTKNKKNILIDVGPDFREQCLQSNLQKIDLLFITHMHADHIAGLDDLRPFTFSSEEAIPIYIRKQDMSELKERYRYIFNPDPNFLGSPPPKIELIEMNYHKEILIDDVKITPLEVIHGNGTATGLKINNLAYIPDCHEISEESAQPLMDIEHLIVDGLWPKETSHASHFNIAKAIEFAQSINAKHTYITHMSHYIDYNRESEDLPENIQLAYDGLEIIA